MTFRSLALVALLALAGCSSSGSDEDSGAGAGAADPTALVSLATARSGAVAESLAVYGAVEQNADTQYLLSAPVEATVSRIAAPAGTAVGRGQLVVVLTPSPATRANLARLQADARSTAQAYDRAKRLRADGLASDADVETALSAMQGAEAARAAAATQAGQLQLRAPGPGNVQAIAAHPGELVAAGTPVATIARSGALRARFGIDPAAIARLSRGAGLRLAPRNGGTAITLPIVALDRATDPQTRLAGLFVTVPAGLGSGAGQPLQGIVTLEQAGNAVVIPYAALLDDGGQPYVYVVSKGVAHRKDVQPGASDGETVAIANGLAPGDQVVTAGGTALEDGMKVRTK